MSRYIDDFLDSVSKEIKCKNVLPDISRELKGHIYDLMEGYISEGMSEAEAEGKAVEEMGDPIEIGKALNKTHSPKTEWSIIALISVMVLIGSVALYSLAIDNASMLSIEQLFRVYPAYILIGFGVFAVGFFFDYKGLEKYALHLFIGTLVFLFASTKLGYRINGAPRIAIAGLELSPASVAIASFLVAFSGLVNKWAKGRVIDMLKLLFLSLLAVFTCLSQPSVSTALLLIWGFGIIILLAIMSKDFNGNRRLYLLSLTGAGLLSIILFIINIMQNHFMRARLFIFLNPGQDPNGNGYINTVINKMLSGANMLGKGEDMYFIHEGASRMALPEASTDFIFTYIISAFGWLAGIITIAVIVLAIVRMFLLVLKIKESYGRYLSTSIVSVFALQALANILMNLGMFPIAGFHLPFISYGGTNFVINMGLMGLLLGVYRRKDLCIASKGMPHGISD